MPVVIARFAGSGQRPYSVRRIDKTHLPVRDGSKYFKVQLRGASFIEIPEQRFVCLLNFHHDCGSKTLIQWTDGKEKQPNDNSAARN